jgi:poly-gamma-glutamate synthesis protein (capsule biosynthesis protein)
MVILPYIVHAPCLNHLENIFSNKNSKPITIGFGGDMMFDRYIRTRGDEIGFEELLFPLKALFSNHDLVVVNLEGPITDFSSVSVGSQVLEPNNYIFTFPSVVAKTLKKIGVTHVSLGNNHILNFGNLGLSQTKQYLNDAGIKYFGEPFTETPHIKTLNGISIGFIAFNEFAPPPKDIIVKALHDLEEIVDFIVVYSHWGYEYEHEPNIIQRQLAHEFIDAGADLVVGSHPHVIQSSEVYRDKHIYYSLGNLIFDQYWEESVRCGLFISVTINPKDFSYTTQETTVHLEKDGSTVIAPCNR